MYVVVLVSYLISFHLSFKVYVVQYILCRLSSFFLFSKWELLNLEGEPGRYTAKLLAVSNCTRPIIMIIRNFLFDFQLSFHLDIARLHVYGYTQVLQITEESKATGSQGEIFSSAMKELPQRTVVCRVRNRVPAFQRSKREKREIQTEGGTKKMRVINNLIMAVGAYNTPQRERRKVGR